jgi:hypothetical protein
MVGQIEKRYRRKGIKIIITTDFPDDTDFFREFCFALLSLVSKIRPEKNDCEDLNSLIFTT